ncbi:hypothetical protein SAY87_030720 [Trapa incisa]|uniref:Uncharacterized protein n=1 Tax=Trapa incisa TaxID=236973 RepID=A0AAN7KJB8_9MYRT|nr:hypothetical protein SAY87_030720 [Trapa incisa]
MKKEPLIPSVGLWKKNQANPNYLYKEPRESCPASSTEGFLEGRFGTAMAGLEQQVKDRAYELKVLFKKGAKIVGEYGKKGWNKVKNIKR